MSVIRELEEIEALDEADAANNATVLSLFRIVFARFDNLDEALRRLAATIGGEDDPAVTGTITVKKD